MTAPLDPRTAEPQTRFVRKDLPHDSAAKHVAGTATYIDDVVEPVGTLHIAPGWARKSVRGKILRLDLNAVKAYPGVVEVLTAESIRGTNDCSSAFGDDPVLASDEVLFYGQVIFAVVAETRDAARKAAQQAVIEVEPITPIITAEDAVAADITVLPDYQFRRGSPETGMTAAERRLSGVMHIGGQEHFYLEGQIAMAVPQEDGGMFVYSSTQHPTEIQHTVAKVLGVPDALVTAEVRRMGGGFGGKESQANQWASLAALAAQVTCKPCKMRLDRDDDMIMTGKRHDFRVEWEIGHDSAGRIRAVEINFLGRCGYSADLSLGINDRTMFHADSSYFYPDAAIRSRRLKTDTCSNTAFRGFGGPQGMLAAERMIDAIAISLGMDPLEVRKLNFYDGERNLTPYGMPVEEFETLHELIQQLEASSDYWARRDAVRAFNAENAVLKKGLALTPVKFGISFTLKHLNQAGALVHLYTDGSIHLNHGGTEMGQGLYQKVAQVVADEFGVTMDKVRITATNTSKVPNTAPTAASSGTDLNAMAARNAASEIKSRLIAFLCEQHGCGAEAIHFGDNKVLVGDKSFSLGEIAKQAHMARIQMSHAGFYATPGITWDRESATGRPFFYFAYGGACSEVTIDTMTGEMTVDRVDILHDVGHSLNPAIDLGQIEGGFVQGMGWLTTEELVWDEHGRLRTHAPSTYKIPTASDVPEDFRVKLYESRGNPAETIYRSKAVGEPPLMLANSVFCAINDAVASLKPGVVPELNAPATPEAIMSAVHKIKRAPAARHGEPETS
ncbi:xanthine dehydrogenase molybdenum binding subunit apoprotein [Roseibium hamelinense]|uniref:Xanthine dehydrogenase molybdenum binding subunit apoprotein n=1 Tax=Roseibium hamelinense TaxID=150831 RepID=A0A562TIB5_9HYPH|nr:xanthine dehydrogenase molybdopterin binding subunit [Roseibium hamelinense]MTI45813.1 xanthine dehydrogenase molybdopterin binding subunit [Roseibium hamelinense]TWI93004.1 xanthine dehydrogenase molybdenum binding subunit apoprotein [Roseibium hamelinense]